MLEQTLFEGFGAMGLGLTEEAAGRFRLYYESLTETNKVMNLTAISGEEQVAILHFMDSAAILSALPFSGKSVIDVGSGAGFPGLPMKIAEPGIRLTLLDSLGKRVDFLTRLCGELGFGDVECIHSRAEEPDQRREQYDFAVSRAVARLNVLSELCLPYVKPGGYFVALKGPAAADELSEAENAIKSLGGQLERIYEYSLPGAELSHKAVIIRKAAPTPKKYPRKFALIKKAPL